MHDPVGFNWFYRFREKLEFDQPLNGDEIKRYIENECRNKNRFNLNLQLKLFDLRIICIYYLMTG